MDDNQREAIELIAAIVRQTDLTPTEIARQAGVAPSTLTRLYPEPSVKTTLSARTLSKLKTAFDLGGHTDTSGTPAIGSRLPLHGMQIAERIASDGPPGTESLCLYTANLQTTSGFAAIHMPGDNRYFATYMPNDVMDPRYRVGEMLVIDTIRPPSIGSDVLVELSSSGDVSLLTLGKLENIQRDQYTLLQYRYGDRGTIHRSHIQRLLSITGVFEG